MLMGPGGLLHLRPVPWELAEVLPSHNDIYRQCQYVCRTQAQAVYFTFVKQSYGNRSTHLVTQMAVLILKIVCL